MNKLMKLRITLSIMLMFAFCQFTMAQNFSSLEGTIQDENGEYMAGVIVEVFSDDIKRATTITDCNGNYVFRPLLTGNYDLKACYPGYEDALIPDVGISYTMHTVQDINFTPKVLSEFTACGRVTPLTLTEPAEKVDVSGKLKDAFNRPAIGVTVELYRNDTFWCSAISGEKGCYKIHDVEPGAYTLITDFKGVKTMERFVEIQEVSYVNEIVANFYFNRKIFNHHGKLVEHGIVANLNRD